MTDLTGFVVSALNSLPACARRAFAQEETPLPVITVSDENASVFAQADGEPYLEEHAVVLRVYAAEAEQAAFLAAWADAALTALGFRLTGSQEAFSETPFAWERTLRFRCLIHQDLIYQ